MDAADGEAIDVLYEGTATYSPTAPCGLFVALCAYEYKEENSAGCTPRHQQSTSLLTRGTTLIHLSNANRKYLI